MAFQPFGCRNCGGSFQHRPGADIFCSEKCARAYDEQRKSAIAELESRGFAVTSAPNVFIKDGIAVTIDEVVHEGLESALRAHELAKQARA